MKKLEDFREHLDENRETYLKLGEMAVSGIATAAQNHAQNQLQRDQIALQRTIHEGEATERRQRQQLSAYEHLMQEAMLNKWKDWQQAKNLFERAIQAFLAAIGERARNGSENVTLCELYYEITLACLHLHQIEQATQYIQTMEDTPNLGVIPFAAAWNFLKARIYFLQDNLPKASSELREILELDPPASLFHLCETLLSFSGYQGDAVIRKVDIWEKSYADLLKRVWRKNQKYSQDEHQALSHASDYFLLKACSYLQNGIFLKSAEYFKRVFYLMEQFTPLAMSIRAHECRLLLLFTSIALCLELSRHQENRAEFLAKLNEVETIFRSYREAKKVNGNTNLSVTNIHANQYRCMISVTIFNRISGILNHYRDFPPEVQAIVYQAEDLAAWEFIQQKPQIPDTPRTPDKLDQVLSRLESIEQHVGMAAIHHDMGLMQEIPAHQEEVVELPAQAPLNYLEITFGLLETAFHQDPYEPVSLQLMTAFTNVQAFQPLVHLARAHLAFCYLHAYRVKRNVQTARELASASQCSRGRAELGYLLWKAPTEARNLAQARELLETAVQENQEYTEHRGNIELQGKFRQQAYLACLNYVANQDRPAALNMLRRIAYQGMVFAQTWLTNLLVFELGGEENLAEAYRWVVRAIADPNTANGPDYFFAKIVEARMHRDGKYFRQDYREAHQALRSAERMGGPESSLEMAMLLTAGFVTANGDSRGVRNLEATTEHERQSAANHWQKAYSLNYVDRRISSDEKSRWGLIYFIQNFYHGAWIPRPQLTNAIEIIEQLQEKDPDLIPRENINHAILYYYLTLCLLYRRQFDAARVVQELPRILGNANEFANRRAPNNSEIRRRALARFAFLQPAQNPFQEEIQALNFVSPTVLRPSLCATTDGKKMLLIFKDPKTQEILLNAGKYSENTQSLIWNQSLIQGTFRGNYTHPRIAINSQGRVLAVAQNGLHLDFRLGQCNSDLQVNWDPYRENPQHTGSQCSVVFLSDARVMEVHAHEREGRGNLYYRLGRIRNNTIEWDGSIEVNTGVIRNPTIAIRNNRILIAFERGNQIGVICGMYQPQPQTITLNAAVYFGEAEGLLRHKTPAVMVRNVNNFILLTSASSARDDGLYCSRLQFNGQGQLILDHLRNYDVGYWPTATLIGERIISFHDFNQCFETSRLCRHDSELAEIDAEPVLIGNLRR